MDRQNEDGKHNNDCIYSMFGSEQSVFKLVEECPTIKKNARKRDREEVENEKKIIIKCLLTPKEKLAMDTMIE